MPPKSTTSLSMDWSHWFLYGNTGAGKTRCAATFPSPVFIQPKNEGSTTSLIDVGDFPFYEATCMEETATKNGKPVGAPDGVGGLNNILWELETQYRSAPNKFPYETIVLESLTHYSDLVVEQLTNGNNKNMDQQRWGQLTAHLRNVQARLKNMQVFVVYTALAKVATTDAGVVVAGVALPGAAALKLPSACDSIGYCEALPAKQNQWHGRVHFKKCGPYDARSRFNIPKQIDNFDFNDLQPQAVAELEPETQTTE